MNAQSIANFEGKLINVALTNDSIKKGTIVNVNGEYFMLKAEGEAKARDIIYYDEVKEVTTINTINWKEIYQQYAEIHLKNDSINKGLVTRALNSDFFHLKDEYDHVELIEKDKVKHVVLGKIKGQEVKIEKDTVAVVEGWEKGKYLYSLREEIKEEVKENKLPMDKLTEYFKNEKSESKYSHFKKWQSAYFNDRKYTMHCYFDTTLTINNVKYFAIFAAFNKVQIHIPKLEYNFLIPKQELIMQFNWGKVICLYNGVEMKDCVKYYSLLFPENDANFSLSTEEEFNCIRDIRYLSKKDFKEEKTQPDRLSEILSKAEEKKPQEAKAELPQGVKEEVIKYHDVNNGPLKGLVLLVKEKYTHVNGKIEGQYTSWHDNGKVSIRTNYKNGKN
jgi:hypothetical protein